MKVIYKVTKVYLHGQDNKNFLSVWYIEVYLWFEQFTTSQSTNAESVACSEYSLQISGKLHSEMNTLKLAIMTFMSYRWIFHATA